MAFGLNKASLIGNVGNDPEFRFTKEGKEFCNFFIATTDTWRDKYSGARRERTEWHRIVVFNEGLVELVRKLVKKGSKLYIEGSIQTRRFTDAKNQEVSKTEIVLQTGGTVILLDSKKDKAKYEEGSDSDTTSGESNSNSRNDTPIGDANVSVVNSNLDDLDDNLDDKVPF